MAYLGENIPKLGFGLMRLPLIGESIDMEQTKQMVDLFLEKGFTYFDTAYGYNEGQSEEAIKEALVDRYPRDRYQLATKLPAWAAATQQEAQEMFWTSLKRTGVQYFDFYLLHNLNVNRTEAFDRFGIWEFLAEQKKQGRIRHLGFSLHAKADHLEEVLVKHPEMEFVQLQINYADWESEIIQARKCYEVARKHNKPVIVMEPVKGGALAQLPEQVVKVFSQADPNASPVAWALRYVAALEGLITILSGMSTLEQMEENISIMENVQPFSKEEMSVIQEAQKVLADIPQVPCTDCQYCLNDCPENIAIPGTFRVMNDYLIYNDLDRAKRSYMWETSYAAKASECISCGQCEEVCPQSISIMEELAKAAVLLEEQ